MKYDVSHVLFTAGTGREEWRYATDLIRSLADLEIRSTLVTMGTEPTSDQLQEAGAIAGLDLITSVFRLEEMEDPWGDVDAAGLWLLALARQIEPDLIHLRSAIHASMPFEPPVVAAFHGLPALAKDDPEYRRRLDLGLHLADLVVASTHTALLNLPIKAGSNARSVVVPIGVEDGKTSGAAKRNMVLAVCPPGSKGKALLEEVAPGLEWPLYIAGENGPSATRLPNLIRLGAIRAATLGAWFARTAVYAMPSSHAPIAYDVQDAAMAGSALVLGDEPALRERWDGIARFVDPRPESWRRTLNELSQAPDHVAAMGARAKARAKEFTARDMARTMQGVYRDLRLACLLDAKPDRRARML